MPRKRWRPIAIAAASLAFVAMGAAMWFNQDKQAEQNVSEAQASGYYLQSPSELEQAADYAMLDATDMYALLSGEWLRLEISYEEAYTYTYVGNGIYSHFCLAWAEIWSQPI